MVICSIFSFQFYVSLSNLEEIMFISVSEFQSLLKNFWFWGQFVVDTAIRPSSANIEDTNEQKQEFWFAMPRHKIDAIYHFLLQWDPEKCGSASFPIFYLHLCSYMHIFETVVESFWKRSWYFREYDVIKNVMKLENLVKICQRSFTKNTVFCLCGFV